VTEDAVIVVVGVGSAELIPDRVRAMVGVSSVAPTIGQALSDAARAQEDIVNVALAAGVGRSSIQTAGYHVGENYAPSGAGGGHRADASLSIVVEDMALAGSLLGSMAEAVGDAFRVHGVRPEASDMEGGRRVARESAVGAARRQAQELAMAAGVQLGKLLSLVEDSASHRPPGVFREAVALSGSAPGIEGGTLTVHVAVTATYDLIA
jgi:uncharacterized protein